MKILFAGGTGFIGSSLCAHLLREKYEITVLSRHPDTIKLPVHGISRLEQLNDDIFFDIVINLAGEPIANKRWTDKQKQLISSSRIETTRNLVNYFKVTKHKPKLLINSSAIGYYGIGMANEVINEDGLGDESFSSQLCQQWEATALEAQSLGVRTCLLRTGIVLGKNGGALNKMLPLFRFGLGGKTGSGKQWMSWIHVDDFVGITLCCIKRNDLSGPVNVTSPNPVTNEVFAEILGKVLRRPGIITIPAVVVKILMGQMGEELLLAGKKILPAKMLNAGYKFKYEKLYESLSDIV